jgi:cell division protein FtsB
MKSFFKKSVVIPILLILVVIFIGSRAVRMVWDTVLLYRESQDVEAQIEELVQKKQELEAYIAEFESSEAVRREAKERRNLKNSGEQVVVVLPDEPSQTEQGDNKNLWDSIKTFFFSY